MTSAMAIERIQYAYRHGERTIEVTPEIFRAYSASLITNDRLVPQLQAALDNGYRETRKWLAYKDARVVEKS